MEKKNEDKKQITKKKKIIIICIATLLAFLVAACIISIPLITKSDVKEAIIVVKEGDNLNDLRKKLEENFDKSFSEKVVRSAKLMGPFFRLRHGAYQIEKGSSAMQAARKLGRGTKHVVTISLNNIRTPEQLAEKVSAKLNFSKEDFLKALGNDTIARSFGLNSSEIMSLFLADSYEFYWNSTPEEFITRMGENYNRFWNDERRAKAANLGLTPAEISIIASIADEESNKTDEKGHICRLYLNRIKKGMKLQADPTVKYAIGDFSIRRVLNKHLTFDSPYNTYKYAGLPPGPIRIINKTTVDEFLNSQSCEDLYMCAKEDFSGYHNFAVSYDEHLANARRYQEKLNERGIK